MSNLEEHTEISVISEDAARNLLSPYRDLLRQCIKEAWEAWEKFGKVAADLRAPLGNRSRASFVYDHMIANVRKKFDDLPNVRIRDKGGVTILDIEGKVCIRFKKLDKNRKSRNYPTQQHLMFAMQMELPGIPAKQTTLITGYRLDLFETTIDEICVTCPVGKKLRWYFSIEDDGFSNVRPIDRNGAIPVQAEVRVIPVDKKKTEEQ